MGGHLPELLPISGTNIAILLKETPPSEGVFEHNQTNG